MDISNKSVSLIVVNLDKEDDVHVYLGNIVSTADGPHFVNTDKKWDVSLSEEVLSEIRVVPSSLKETLLGTDLYFTLRMKDIPEGESLTQYTKTGLKWH